MRAEPPATGNVECSWDAAPSREHLLRGEWRAAEALCEAELLGNPSNPEALHLLAVSRSLAGGHQEAAALLCRALAICPDRVDWRRDLAIVLLATGQWEAAVRALECVQLAKPDDRDVRLLYAHALTGAGRPMEALALYEQESARGALASDVLRNKGRALLACGRQPEAAAAFEQSLELDPLSAPAHQLAAGAYVADRRFDKARFHAAEVCKLRGNDAPSLADLGISLWETGELDGALRCFRDALEKYPNPRVHTAYLLAVLHDYRQTRQSILAEHTEWAERYTTTGVPPAPYTNGKDPDKRLRIGYLSGEFYAGAAFYHFFPLLENHRSDRVETFLYHTLRNSDAATARCENTCDRWRNVSAASDDEIAALIREDQIDILVDLSGHFPCHALAVFARRPAPVQAAFAVYPSTTGLKEIDYILTDSWLSPPGTEDAYTERVYRLPSGCIAYPPPHTLPALTPLNAARPGAVTFGLFQKPAKLNPPMWDLIAAVLTRLPDSTLLIHQGNRDLDDVSGPSRRGMLAELRSRGITESRVRFAGYVPRTEHLELVRQADIALDTLPYSGQTTTFDCIWMGIPVVTLPGQTHAGRTAMEILSRLGLQDWIARTPEEYIGMAANAALDLDRLGALRAGLRSRIAASNLSRGIDLAREVEDGYRSIWRQYCCG